MEQILSVAFVVAVVAFFKTQFGLANGQALIAAFVVSLVVGLVPQAVTAFPALQPWVLAVQNVIVVFFSAAGSYDFVSSMIAKAKA